MNIISSLSLQNFRGFRDSGRVKLAPLTFLVGPNSSGKSTIANAIMLVAQSFSQRTGTKFSSDWIGRLVDLGSFEDTVFRHNVKNTISVEIGLKLLAAPGYATKNSKNTGREVTWKWDIRDVSNKKKAIDLVSSRVNNLTISDVISGAEINIQQLQNQFVLKFNDVEHRIKSDSDFSFSDHRAIAWGIKDFLEKKPLSLKFSMAGYKRILESYSTIWLYRFFGDFERVTSARSGPKRWVAKDNLSSEGNESSLFNDPYSIDIGIRNMKTRKDSNREPIVNYLKELGIASTLERIDLSAYHTALQVTDSITNVRSNLADIGFGASQVIPVLKGCLVRSYGPLVIEQPEIHLHPKAQSQIADLICESSNFRQIFVETHSEHMINRARIKIMEGKLKPEDITILYIDKTARGSKVTQIGVTKDGDFTQPWPEGFFDERYQDSMTLLKLKSKNKVVIELNEKNPAANKTRGGKN